MRAQFDDGPGTYGWSDFEEDEADHIDGKFFLTIHDPDGEEFAVIAHRVCDGKYPLDGPIANEKRRNAQQIVAALNATIDLDLINRREYS